jgi:hypothetical protein
MEAVGSSVMSVELQNYSEPQFNYKPTTYFLRLDPSTSKWKVRHLVVMLACFSSYYNKGLGGGVSRQPLIPGLLPTAPGDVPTKRGLLGAVMRMNRTDVPETKRLSCVRLWVDLTHPGGRWVNKHAIRRINYQDDFRGQSDAWKAESKSNESTGPSSLLHDWV